MQNQAQLPTENTPPVQKKSLWRRVRLAIYALILLIVFLLAAILVLASSDKGSKWLLDWVMARQQMVHYQYVGGNIIRGLQLKDIVVKVKDTEVQVKDADVRLGWRAILKREMHFMTAKIGQVDVIDHAPPNDKPFAFSELKLPFVLVLDDASVAQLNLKSTHSSHVTHMNNIQLYDATWSDYKIELNRSSISLYGIDAKNVTGHIELYKKYPLFLDGDVYIDSLKGLNLQHISVAARGDIDRLAVGVASLTPDLITGSLVLHPVQHHVPMRGFVKWADFHVPVATEQELFAQAGQLNIDGNSEGLNLHLDTALKGKNIPEGSYQAKMFTDFKTMKIDEFIGHVINGQITLAGDVDWQNGVKWNVKGRADGLNRHDPLIPQAVRDFLPNNLNANLSSKGEYHDQAKITAHVDFDQAEKWQVQLNHNNIKNTKLPWHVLTSWQGINREFPHIGWLNSERGDVNLELQSNLKAIQVSTKIAAHEKSVLPVGTYAADLELSDKELLVHDFVLVQNDQSRLSGVGTVVLPNDKQQLAFIADINAVNFNPQQINAAVPVNQLNGRFSIDAYQKDHQFIGNLSNLDLKGQIVQEKSAAQNVHLTGKATLVAIMHNAPQSGLKSYAVRYDGGLNADGYSQGPLRLNMSGTPQYINVEELYHQGAAGLIQAKGMVNLVNGIDWNINANLQNFKPHYFYAQAQGDLTGIINTTGQWSDNRKQVNISQLNLRGQLLNKPLLAQGQLNIQLAKNSQGQLIPQQFQANNLVVSYANNVVQAVGNAQLLKLNISANRLAELYPGLSGDVKGVIAVTTQPNLTASANLIGSKFAFQDKFSVDNLRVLGRLPLEQQATQLQVELNQLKAGDKELDQAQLLLQGTRRAHLLKAQTHAKDSQFFAQLAGGFNENFDWFGELQQGQFRSKRVLLQQSQNAALIYKNQNKQLSLAAHCWIGQNNPNSQICLDQPLLVNPEQGAVSAQVKNIQLADFAAFMPADLAVDGVLNGYSKLSWQKDQPMQLDARLITQNGNIGLAGEDEQAQISRLAYKELRIDAKTLAQGLSLKVNADTPLLGTGFADVIIGTQTTNKTLSGEVALNAMQLSVLRPFMSDVRVLDGKLSAAGRLSGTFQQPLFNGEVRVQNANFALLSAPVNLQNIQLASSIRGSQADIRGSFAAGRGLGRITGNAIWAGDPNIKLKVEGQELLVAQPPSISASVSPAIDIDIRPVQKQLVVSGNVNIPRALITMPESSPDVVANSEDLRIVRSDQPLVIAQRAKPWNIRANVGVTLGNGVIFRGFDSNIPLAGALQLSQRGENLALQANGAIGISRQVKIEAYGQSLDLKRAIARFGGNLSNPSLDIDANKGVQNSTIGIRVTGNASRPNIVIYNDAGLSEQQALNALLTGSISNDRNTNTESFKSDVNNTIAAAGISMGLGSTRALTNQIGRTFGLSGLALDAQGTGNDTQISVTGYITPDLYLRYGVGIFTPVTKLTLRYQVNRRLYLEASSSIERAVDIFYNWRF
ncbi:MULTISPECIES: translocation/assembly module TamB domain-containing protein [unclassified Acinetobacter]|uniref:translocation/assembly module TamB domain-containing protein n=1 Tax=unclassified Acinetobacter TaxID=196816 RepID=UPI0035B9B7A7